ncbi:MAG: hypothetical protein JWR32_5905 [Mycobacterium sp.]|jgi:hypothetical protein|nr:hypothetical protein [Mycobacterium sp.]
MVGKPDGELTLRYEASINGIFGSPVPRQMTPRRRVGKFFDEPADHCVGGRNTVLMIPNIADHAKGEQL